MIARAEFKDNGVFQALRQWKKDAHDSVKVGVTDALKKFEKDFILNRLQRREEDSLGVRKGGLRRSIRRQVKSRGQNHIYGRVYFHGDKAQMIARTQQFGATIRPKTGKYLTFKLFKKYSRRAWNFPKPEQWIRTKQVKIPARLRFFQDWEKYHPHAIKILENARDKAVAKGRAMFS
jgi:hypothetical protein